jgi:hypothetical protein
MAGLIDWINIRPARESLCYELALRWHFSPTAPQHGSDDPIRMAPTVREREANRLILRMHNTIFLWFYLHVLS